MDSINKAVALAGMAATGAGREEAAQGEVKKRGDTDPGEKRLT